MKSLATLMRQAEKILDEMQQDELDADVSVEYHAEGIGFPMSEESRMVVFCDEKPTGNYREDTVFLPAKSRLLFTPKRTKVMEGGRGSAKSRSAVAALVLRCTQARTRVLCCRELQHSIQESVHKLVADTIERLGYDKYYTVTKTHIRCRNGSEFIFSGIKNNVKKIKSMEDVDVCLCEEAEAITEESWKVLTPTIRAPGSEIWVIFNPYDEMDATYTRYITPWEDALRDEGHYEDSQIAVQCMNYPDNPWFPEELRLEMEKMKEEHYIDYLHVWLGQAVGASENAIISPLWIKAAVDAHLHIGFKPRGIKCVGFDPADEGADSKALCVRHGSVVIECESWYSGDVSDAIDRAFDKAYEIRATDLVYDQVGVGAAVKHHINQIEGRDGFTTSGFLGNDIPEDPAALYMDDRRMDDVFRNRRAQAFWFLRDRFEKTYKVIEKGEYIDPAELISLSSEMEGLTQLKSELSRIERKRKASYKDVIQLESKKEMKDRGLKSPGLADSLMYAFSNPPKTKGWDKPINYGKSGNI